jgi:hypothetical protein
LSKLFSKDRYDQKNIVIDNSSPSSNKLEHFYTRFRNVTNFQSAEVATRFVGWKQEKEEREEKNDKDGIQEFFFSTY